MTLSSSTLDLFFDKDFWPTKYERRYRGHLIRIRKDREDKLWGEIQNKLAFVLQEGKPEFEDAIALAEAWIDRKIEYARRKA